MARMSTTAKKCGRSSGWQRSLRAGTRTLELGKPFLCARQHHAEVRVHGNPRVTVLDEARDHLRVRADDAARLAGVATRFRGARELCLDRRVGDVADVSERCRQIAG